MVIYNTGSIIGGKYDNPGCRFDDFDTLINTYFTLLFETITDDGMVYSTGRNGLLARVELDHRKGGFVNYVQSDIGQWNYDDSKYQREVSPEFVLYLFNNLSLLYAYDNINLNNDLLNGKTKFNKKNQSVDGVFFKDLSMNGIIQLHEEHLNEYNKKQEGLPNFFDEIKSGEFHMVNALYDLLSSVVKYSSQFYEFHKQLEQADELRKDVDSGKIDFYSLTDMQNDLYNLEEDEEHYMSLGYLNNFIRQGVAHELIKVQKQKKNAERNGLLSISISQYDDPIEIVEFFDEESDESIYSDGEYFAVISYNGGKEFSNKRVVDIKRGNNWQIRRKK